VLPGRRPCDPEPVHEPRRHGEVAVTDERSPRVQLGDPSEPLGLERATGALDLDHVFLDRLVGGETQVLGPGLLERRSQHPHVGDAIEHVFDGL
jgi:hypothetical protein